MADSKQSYPASLLLVILLISFYELEENIVFPPLIRLLEDAICRQHYAKSVPPTSVVDESMCKTVKIQSDLAFVRGWFGLFKTAPAIIFGPFFGDLADRLGRRPIYALSMLGMMLHLASVYICCHFWNIFAIEVVWLTSLFLTMGGGTFIILALNMTMISDLSTEENRSRRLYFAFALKYIADLAGPQIASVTLSHSLWLPIALCELCFVMSLIALLAIPETLIRKDNHTDETFNGGLLTMAAFKTFYNLLSRWKILVAMLITFLTQFRYLNESILLPYTSMRFSWSISQISRLLSIIPGISLFVFLSLPYLTWILEERLSFNNHRQSLFVVRILLLHLVLGGALTAFAPSITMLILALVIFSVGNGIRAPLLAVASSYIDPSAETGRLYTIMSVTDAFSHMIGEPIIQSIWSAALELERHWRMLPFGVTTGLFAIAFLLSFFLIDANQEELKGRRENVGNASAEGEPLLDNQALSD